MPNILRTIKGMKVRDVDLEWDNFVRDAETTNIIEKPITQTLDSEYIERPVCGELKISTKTVIVYLNTPIDIYQLFWKTKIQKYYYMSEGIIKKQIKIESKTENDLQKVLDRINPNDVVTHTILEKKGNKCSFYDLRIVSIGCSKHDVLQKRKNKQLSIFYNCFVMTLRIHTSNDIFHDIHVKIFKTGKLEIPGVTNDEVYKRTLELFIELYREFMNSSVIAYNVDTILINSNFICGYMIDRSILYNLLKTKYNIHVSYDPCSYPGVRAKFFYYHDNHSGIKQANRTDHIEVSFFAFRTGSVLIAGKFADNILQFIYKFLCNLYYNEYEIIRSRSSVIPPPKQKRIERQKTYRFVNQREICNGDMTLRNTGNK